MKIQTHRTAVSVIFLILTATLPSLAQEGKLKINVSPKQAYAFVDGRAYGEATLHALYLSPGDHKIDLYNYGYLPASASVSITAGKTTNLEVTLTPVLSRISGPVGAMTIEGANRDAVLLNGKTPDFFVGHGDEFDHEWWWKQELVVPPGTYQVTILGLKGSEIWSGAVDVPVNQRVVLDIPKGVRKTVPWPRGEKLSTLARFAAGTATATVAVAKPTAELSATAGQVNCGDASQLKWSSSDAPQVEITPVGPVAASGEQAVQPTQNTTYQLTAVGPGGTVTSSTAVNVNTAVQADLGFSPAEVHYKRVGDQVVEDSGAALNWTASNASKVSIDPLGAVDSSGNRTLKVAPRKTDPGSVDETVTYTLNASNGCGGSETKTATLRIVGSIEPEPTLSMRSVYFPTDRPRTLKSEDALLPSETDTLKTIAVEFKKYIAFKPDARLVLSGHADQRGPQAYNKPLSQRRAELAKRFLVEQGIPEANIETQAYGKEKNLTADQVKQLLEQDTALSPEERQKTLQKLTTIVLSYNRRVDLTLTPPGQESTHMYPFKTEDFARLVDRNGPNKGSGVELAAERKKVEN
ncbi:MAG TPA: OmpA family protein [Terriglobales bacterium]|nr:OmpA family protein [Terriglobales bacterium]